jgi:hypothetical protein
MKRTSCTSYEKLEQAKLPQKKLLSENLFKNSNSLKTRKTHALNTESDASEREKERKRVICVARHTKTRVSVVAVKR